MRELSVFFVGGGIICNYGRKWGRINSCQVELILEYGGGQVRSLNLVV